MTTTPKETHMPTDPNHRALLRAVEKLTTQVRRIADTLETPAVTDDDGAQTTADDTRRCVCGDPLQWYTAHGGASGWVHDSVPGRPILDVHMPRPADVPAWKLCTCGDKPATARHPEPCPLSREPYASELAEIHGTPWPAMPYKMCSATTKSPSGRTLGPCVLQYQHDEPIHQDAEGTYWAQRIAVPDMQHVTATMRENEQLRTELARVRRALDPDDETYIRETVDDQLAMTATLSRVRRALADRPALCTDSVYERGWSDAADMVRNALDGPVAEG